MPQRSSVLASASDIEHWRRSCLGKRAYGSRKMAAAAVRRRASQGYGRLSAYRCRWCPAFHVGHTPIEELARMRAG